MLNRIYYLIQIHTRCFALREDFAVANLIQQGHPLFYLKGKRGQKTPDFLVKIKGKPIVLEIGGRQKSWSQFKGIDKKVAKYILTIPTELKGKRVPLILLGFLSNSS